MTASIDTVKRRKVFYVSGFDPKGPAGYYELYVQEAAKQSALSGMKINVGARRRQGRHVARWQIEAEENGQTVTTDYSFLRWDDIIRRHWPRGAFRLFGQMTLTYFAYIRSGVLRRVLANSWPTFICGSYPFFAMLLIGLVSLIIGLVAGLAITALPGWPIWAALAIMLPVAFELYRRISAVVDGKIQMHWVARIYTFSLLQSARKAPEYEARLDALSRIVAEAAQGDAFDEILLIAHSTGAQSAVSILARALKLNPDLARGRAKLSFLTLGGSIPMLSWQPDAGWFHEELQRVACDEDIDWLDFSAAQDGASFALHDPVESTGLSHAAGREAKPKLLSIKLFDLYSAERFKQVHHNWGLVHFQYLMAGEQLAEYDFFAITAGAKILAARYCEREAARGFDRFRIRWLGK